MRRISAAVLEAASHENKQQRILEAFDVLLAERALHVNRKIWKTPFIEEMREWSVDGATHDDALDAVAGCLASEPVRIGSFRADAAPLSQNVWQGSFEQYNAETNFNL